MNPLSYPLIGGPVSYLWRTASSAAGYLIPKGETKMAPPAPLWKLAAGTGPFVRLAAVSGATAVILGAYGAHNSFQHVTEDDKAELKQVFETANRYHFIHTLALLGLPLCRTPYLAATFLLSGITLFCGSCYYYAFTGDKQYGKVTPIGGVCFIIGWLSMCI